MVYMNLQYYKLNHLEVKAGWGWAAAVSGLEAAAGETNPLNIL
jgi:hypothetical protein